MPSTAANALRRTPSTQHSASNTRICSSIAARTNTIALRRSNPDAPPHISAGTRSPRTMPSNMPAQPTSEAMHVGTPGPPMPWKSTGPTHANRPISRPRTLTVRTRAGEGATAPSPASRFGRTIRRAGHGSSDKASSRSARVSRGSGRTSAARTPWAFATRLTTTAAPAAVGFGPRMNIPNSQTTSA